MSTDTRPEDFTVTRDNTPARPGDRGDGGDDTAIRPAASLLVVRTPTHGERQVLMGRRPSTAAFMPGKLVFPGGAVEPADQAGTSINALARCEADHRAMLAHYVTPPALANALPAAALREFTEETGLSLPPETPLRLIARAITPPGRTRRFDAWFFYADIGSHACQRVREPDEELLGLDWFGLSQALAEPLAAVTRFVLDHTLPGHNGKTGDRRPVFLRKIGGGFVISPLIAADFHAPHTPEC